MSVRIYSLEALERARQLLHDHAPAVGIETIRKEIADAGMEEEIVSMACEGATTPDVLDLADFYFLLSKLEAGERICTDEAKEACHKMLRRAIYLPEKDPPGVKITVITRPLGDGSNVAMIRVTPENKKPNTAPDVFIGGMFEPAGTYLPGAVSAAIAEGNEFIIVDSAGVGGSRLSSGNSVGHKNIVRIFDAVLKEAGGRIRYLMGHSMGAMVVRHQYYERKLKGIGKIEKYICIAGAPGADEVHASFRPGPEISDQSFGQIVSRGRMWATHDNVEDFMKSHTPEERREFERTAREEDLRLSNGLADKPGLSLNGPLTFLETTAMTADEPLLHHVGRDETLITVVGKDDELLQLNNPEAWERRRGILVLEDGDHASPAGEVTGPRFFTALYRFINERPDIAKNWQLIDQDEASRWGSGMIGPTLQLSSRLGSNPAMNYGLGPAALAQHGLNRWSTLLFGAQVVATGTHGFENDSNSFSLPATVSAGLSVAPLPRTARWNIIPLQFSGGGDLWNGEWLPVSAAASVLRDFGPTGFHEGLYVAGGYHPVNETPSPLETGLMFYWGMGGVGRTRLMAGVQFDPWNDLPTTAVIKYELMKGAGYFTF